MQSTRKTQQGFTLIELMIAVAIIAILSAIAFPAYKNYITHARRSEALAALNDAAARMERYYAQNNTYATATLALLSLGSGSTYNTPNNYYAVGISNPIPTTTTYTIKATPQGQQATDDTACGAMSIDQAGVRTPATAACWK